MRSSSFIAAAIALAAPFAAMATHIDPPKVPDTLAVPAGSKAFLIGHAVGTQNYICLPDGAGAKWVLFGPQATVFDDAAAHVVDFDNPLTAGVSSNTVYVGVSRTG